MVRVRFAPVPSGNLHLGGLKIFLVNWLLAKKYNGKFILRFEDTDPRISFFEYEESILRTLAWLGFNLDFEIYRQSLRHDVYRQTALDLVKNGAAYPCFCSREEILERSGKNQAHYKEAGIKYDGKCRNLKPGEIAHKLSLGIRPVYRFKVSPAVVEFEDEVKGNVRFNTSEMGDFIILRSDGTGVYNFACAVDDCKMGITHVIRGEDHLVNTPLQILIHRALNNKPPVFAHLPLMLSAAGSKYSKRYRDLSIFEMKRAGFLPEAILNYVYRAGMKGGISREILDLERMVDDFEISCVSPKFFHFDPQHLNFLNRRAMEKSDPVQLRKYVLDYLRQKGIPENSVQGERLDVLDSLLPEIVKRSSNLTDLSSSAFAIISRALIPDKKALKILKEEKMTARLETLTNIIIGEPDYNKIKEKIFRRKKSLASPVRIAVTAKADGPPVSAILDSIDRKMLEEYLERLWGWKNQNKGDVNDGVSRDTINFERWTNKLAYYFEKKLNFKVEDIKNLPGFRNMCWKVRCKEGVFGVKKSLDRNFNKLHVEKEALFHLGQLDLSPKDPYLDLSLEYIPEPILIYSWVEGVVPLLINRSRYEQICSYLARLHSYSVLSLPMLPTRSLEDLYEDLKISFEYFKNMRKSAGLEEDALIKLIGEKINKLEPAVGRFSNLWNDKIPLSVIHGDLRPTNLVFKPGRVLAIDWEEAGIGDPAFELCLFFLINNLEESEKKEFIEIYHDLYREFFPEDDSFRQRLKIYQPFGFLLSSVNAASRVIELLQGMTLTTVPHQRYIHNEVDRIYGELAVALNLVEQFIDTSSGEYSPSMLKNVGRIAPIPPKLEKGAIIVIDGPSSTGKSLVAPRAAKRLDYFYVNLGAFFRAITIYLLGNNIQPGTPEIKAALENIDLDYRVTEEYPHFRVVVNSKDLTPGLYTHLVEEKVPDFSTNEIVINFVKKIVSQLIKRQKGAVVEGRKAGIEFFPSADYKFYLEMNKKDRATLKYKQIYSDEVSSQPGDAEIEKVLEHLETRDKRDFEKLKARDYPGYFKINVSPDNVEKAVAQIFQAME